MMVKVMAAGVVPVQGKLASRTQNISSCKMLGCRLCTGTDALWKDKTAVAHQGVGCPAGERGQMESWACGGLCNLALVADSERKAFAPPSATVIAADAPP